MMHPKANPTKDGTARPTPHVAQTGDPSETVRRRVRWRGARRGATGLGMEDGGVWVVGAGREDGGERDGRRVKMEGSEAGGAWGRDGGE